MYTNDVRKKYNLIKSITGFVFVCMVITLISMLTPKLYAQTPQKQMLVATPYTFMQDLDFFFDNSSYALGFYDGNAIDPSLFLSVVTSSQYKNLLREGYEPKIIDNNLGDLTQYYELTNGRNPGEAKELNKQEYAKKGLVMVYPLTRNKTLVKMLPGKQFSSITFPGSKYYSEKQLNNSVNRPTNRAFLREQLRITESTVTAQMDKRDYSAFYKLQWISSLILLIGTTGFVILMLRKKSTEV